jgi:hypothetical protein
VATDQRAENLAQRAEVVAANTQIQEQFGAANRTLIIANCRAVEDFKAGVRSFLQDAVAAAPPDRQAETMARFDAAAPPIDCDNIPTEAP